ncbi:MAG: hypothetical protein WCT10_04235 [Patescibacteria group bacterium]
MDLFPKLFPELESLRRWKLPLPDHFDVCVDPRMSFKELVHWAGFDRVSGLTGFDSLKRPWPEIYPAKGGKPYVRRFELLQLCGDHQRLDLDEALAVLAARGYRPADAREFLSFLAQYPHRQRRQHDIIPLGAVYQEEDRVYVLEVFDRPNEREYRLVYLLLRSRSLRSYWLSHHRFLATRLDP